MGVPIKQSLSGQPVFVCCKRCVKKLAAEPALPDTATLADKIKGALKVTD